VVYPDELAAALKALSVAKTWASQATKLASFGRQVLETEYLVAKQAHDDAQAAKVGPEDFKPYPVARPDVEHLAALNSAYARNLKLAQVAVERAAGDYATAFEALLAVWSTLPLVDAEKHTVAEAQAIEEDNTAAKVALIEANAALAKLSGMDDLSRKRLRLRQKEQPGRLISLDEVIAEIEGRTPATVARDKAAVDALAAERAKVKAEASDSAKRRVGSSA
jgi:hypothetical protein